ncbi:MAG: DEAD/DEAH box helicase [Gammaproteobacteria bacterium]|nr:DEAD/DEAH box helicase [Gammaproteobacteria bacterium]
MSFLQKIKIATAQGLLNYAACDQTEQIILRVLSVINKPIGQQRFKQVLSELSHSDNFSRQKLQKFYTPELKDKLASLSLINVGRDGIQISKYIADDLTKICLKDGSFEEIIDASEKIVPIEPLYHWHAPIRDDIQRQIRDCFYRRQYNRCIALLDFDKNPQIIDIAANEVLVNSCFYPYSPIEFLNLPPVLQYQAFATILGHLRRDLIDNSEIIQLIEQVGTSNDDLRLLLAQHYIFCGKLDLALAMLSPDETSNYALELNGCCHFLLGNPEQACDYFSRALTAKNKIARRKKQYIGGINGLFYLMALLQLGSDIKPAMLTVLFNELDNQLDDHRADNNYQQIAMVFKKLGYVFIGKQSRFELASEPYFHYSNFYSHIQILFSCVASCWANEKPNHVYLQKLVEACEDFSRSGQLFFANTALSLLSFYRIDVDPECKSLVSNNDCGVNLTKLVIRKEAWVLALEQLIALDQNVVSPKSLGVKESRLVWLFDPNAYGYSFEAKEQKLGKQGWSKGRAVALKRLFQEYQTFDYLSPEDMEMCRQVSKGFDGGYYGRDIYELVGYQALKAAVNLGNVYLVDDPAQAIEIIANEPELLIAERQDGYLLSMANIPSNHEDSTVSYSLTPLTKHRYQLIKYEKNHLKIASIVGEGGLLVPTSAKDKVLQSISAIAPMLNIQSDIAGLNTGIEQVVADQCLYINVQPAGEGLEFECHVQPLGPDGPGLTPGLGNPTFSCEVQGQRLSTTRDLGQERLQLQLLVQACGSFDYMIDNRLLLDRLDDALDTIERLELLNHPEATKNKPWHGLKIVLQWPKGKTFKLSKKLGLPQIQLAVTKQKEWFGLEGQLTVADDQVIELKTLLELISQSNGRFIKLDNDQILSLTDELRQRLQDLDRVSEQGKFHALASPLVEVATQGMRMKTLHAWDRQRDLLEQAAQLTPQLPSTLQALLRDYQVEGFDWAMRLAHWGAGACLADDMGLGKTLQALAMMLARANKGPTLVLAPTSVCFNWQQEAARFAPTLKVKILGVDTSTKEQRQAMIENAGAFDVVVCSYGLLQREAELLAKPKWYTIVADEAQALKNPLAQRTQAAMALSGQFKMITTGTPIENNLTELWSLFRFINPGLLGSQKQFHQRFSNVIESVKTSDQLAIKRASQGLRQLISPFILRRMKNQVLTELPSRTEINIQVELSEQEVVLYEALRQQAIANMSKGDIDPGQHHIKMLAEIMKLRRACCHPSLVMPDSEIEGSKLKAFDNLISELKQNNHKALVFSQFVGHLSILRQHLDRRGISYQYLDGSTPAKQRRDAVNAFQAGHGDVFLISLKAGGSGLNLTAADYVIHMDPWWNPAVEDQASDRAHRMGQTRPVTIYRLIAKNTIEDKIVALHQQKRDLANSLLEGSDSAGKITVNDMMSLLQQSI